MDDKLACRLPNALMCGAKATRLASHNSLSALAAGRQNDGSLNAVTTNETTPMRSDASWVVNHVAYAPGTRSWLS